jgi:hypothetical protein
VQNYNEESEPASFFQPEAHKLPMPGWLRAELREDTSNAAVSEQPANDAVQAQEIARLRAELNQSRGEVARYRRLLSSIETSPQVRERGGCLTAWLILQCVGVAFATVSACVIASRGTPAITLLAIPAVILVGFSISRLWNLKKSGYYIQMVLYSLSLVIAIITALATSSSYGSTGVSESSVGSAIGSLIGMVVLYLLVHDRWEMFE